MFSLFKKKSAKTTTCERFVTCYLVCNRDDHANYIATHTIPNITGRKALFLQEKNAQQFIKERNDKRLVIMVLRVPEVDIKFFSNNTISCECTSSIDVNKCYEKTIYP